MKYVIYLVKVRISIRIYNILNNNIIEHNNIIDI